MFKYLKMQNALRKIKYRNQKPLFVILIMVFVALVFAAIFTLAITDSFTTQNETLTTYDIVNVLIALCTMLSTAYVSRQIFVMQDATSMDITQQLYTENQQRRSIDEKNEAASFIETLMLNCDSEEEIKNAYFRSSNINTNERDNLRQFVFHYEHLGNLVKYNKVNFGLLFDTISFPDAVWEEAIKKFKKGKTQSTISFIESLRSEVRDTWQGFEYLFNCYQVKRKFDAKTIDNNPNNRKELKSAIKNWKKCYKALPLK